MQKAIKQEGTDPSAHRSDFQPKRLNHTYISQSVHFVSHSCEAHLKSLAAQNSDTEQSTSDDISVHGWGSSLIGVSEITTNREWDDFKASEDYKCTR